MDELGEREREREREKSTVARVWVYIRRCGLASGWKRGYIYGEA